MKDKTGMRKGWDTCINNLNGICCKDLDGGRTWVCQKGFPRLHGKYTKCTLPKGTVIEVCNGYQKDNL